MNKTLAFPPPCYFCYGPGLTFFVSLHKHLLVLLLYQNNCYTAQPFKLKTREFYFFFNFWSISRLVQRNAKLYPAANKSSYSCACQLCHLFLCVLPMLLLASPSLPNLLVFPDLMKQMSLLCLRHLSVYFTLVY